MPRYIELPRPSPERVKAMTLVIEQCRNYRGAPIVKKRHSLWWAVVALEMLSRRAPEDHPTRQQHKLDLDLCRPWFKGLHASRYGDKVLAITEIRELMNRTKIAREIEQAQLA